MCGAVAFAFTNEPRFVAECVCRSCREAHGASVVGWVGVLTDQFRLEKGEQHLRWYRSSAASERGFCNACGTRILFRSDKWPGEIHMTLANIDPPHELKSKGLSFADELPAWTCMHPQP